MFKDLKETIEAYKARDPAARSSLEIYFLYPGLKAVRSHRKAHWCYEHNLKFLARFISQCEPSPYGHRDSPRREDRQTPCH